MPSGPSLFDDADASAGPERDDASEPSPVDRPTRSAPHARRAQESRPNYLIRRAVVVGGVVAVLATASVVIGQLMGSGARSTSSGAVPAEWNRIVLLDERTGRVTVSDERGERIGRIDSGTLAPTGSGVVENSMVVVSADRVAVLDLERASDEPATAEEPTTSDSVPADSVPGETGGGASTVFAFGANSVITPTASTLTMIAARADGGRAVLVHGPSGDLIDTDSFSPVVGARYEFADAKSTASGRDVVVTDSGNFQSVLISFDRDEPSFFPGLSLAIDDDVVVTAQNVGAAATINVFDHTGEPLTTGRTDSVRAGMIAGDDVILITVDGQVVTLDATTGDTDDGEQLDIGTVESGHVTTSGDRLVISGSDGTAVVGADAAIVGTYLGAGLATDAIPPTGSQCVALTSLGATPEPDLIVVDLVDGAIVTETAATEPRRSDASGCTIAAATTSGFELVAPEGTEQTRTAGTLVALAPDASKVIVELAGRLVLIDGLESESPSEPIDLIRRGHTASFTQS